CMQSLEFLPFTF
nr:immunoglobulin light chain junction region [Macaca mulatta]MOW54558.1 immunoglobulin light chain junction region [Macaca mulatta]